MRPGAVGVYGPHRHKDGCLVLIETFLKVGRLDQIVCRDSGLVKDNMALSHYHGPT